MPRRFDNLNAFNAARESLSFDDVRLWKVKRGKNLEWKHAGVIERGETSDPRPGFWERIGATRAWNIIWRQQRMETASVLLALDQQTLFTGNNF